MFENNPTQRRLIKRKAYMDALEKAKEEGKDWKVKQLENKIAVMNKKYFTEPFWDSFTKGTYRKPANEL